MPKKPNIFSLLNDHSCILHHQSLETALGHYLPQKKNLYEFLQSLKAIKERVIKKEHLVKIEEIIQLHFKSISNIESIIDGRLLDLCKKSSIYNEIKSLFKEAANVQNIHMEIIVILKDQLHNYDKENYL